jgi:hypothetical protein
MGADIKLDIGIPLLVRANYYFLPQTFFPAKYFIAALVVCQANRTKSHTAIEVFMPIHSAKLEQSANA